MTEAMRNPLRSANGAVLRWTPGPDELRLPSSEPEDEHVPQNTRQLVVNVDSFDSLQRHWRGRPDVFVGSDQFVYWDPAYDRKTNPANAPMAPEEALAEGLVGVRSKKLGLCLCIRPPGPEPLDGALCWYDPAAGEFLRDRHELTDDNRRLASDNRRLASDNSRLADDKRQAEAKVAELTALIEKMRRG